MPTVGDADHDALIADLGLLQRRRRVEVAAALERVDPPEVFAAEPSEGT
jgi:hypothetical protein